MPKQEDKMKSVKETKPCIFSAKDAKAMDIFKQSMAEANVPHMTSLVIENDFDITPRSEDSAQRFGNINSTYTQKKLLKNKFLCTCHCLIHCGKIATLHSQPCNFCHGFPPGGPPHILRYYPEDKGWWTLRHQAERLRNLAGLEKLNEILPIKSNHSMMQYLNYPA